MHVRPVSTKEHISHAGTRSSTVDDTTVAVAVVVAIALLLIALAAVSIAIILVVHWWRQHRKQHSQ